MKKMAISFAILGMISCQNNCRTQKDNNNYQAKTENKSEPNRILSQKRSKREFTRNSLRLIADIPLRETDKPIYRPTYLKYDKYGAIYIMDFSDYTIHKIIPKIDGTRYEHKILVNEGNQSHGGLTRVLDFKVYGDAIYVVNEGSASIDAYSLEGVLNKRVIIGNAFPSKIAISAGNIIVQSKYSPGRLFKMCDMEGKTLYEYGDYIDKSNIDSAIYHDGALSDTFGDGNYYYLPYYLGFVALYQKGKLQYAKETIDGLGKKVEAIEKKVMNKYMVKTITKKYETATMYAIQKEYLLIKASDIENKKSYWDLYDLFSNDYLITINNNPKARFFDVWRDNIACVDDNSLKIYNMNDVLEEAKGYKAIKE